ncbi:MAG TPA: redoxin family protein [Phycisphaerae bacterium]|nr:redoxin family protein [Phycisphaerae bacterium]
MIRRSFQRRGTIVRGFLAISSTVPAVLLLAVIPVTGQQVPASAPTGSPPATQPAGKPQIAVDQIEHDFGSFWVGPALSHTFTLSNPGTADLNITRVTSGCGCTRTGEYPNVLKPGESGKITFTVTTTSFRGPFSKMPAIYSNDPVKPELRLTLKGDAKRYVDVTPTFISYGTLVGKEPIVKTVKLTNNSETPLQVTMDPSSSTPPFKFELVETIPGKEFDLTVTAGPVWGDPGLKRAMVLLKTNIEPEKEIRVSVSGNVIPRLEIVPPTIRVYKNPNRPATAGNNPAGGQAQTAKRAIRFTSRTETPIKLLEIIPSDPSLKIGTKQYGEHTMIEIELPVDYDPAPGAKLTIKTDDTETPMIEVPIQAEMLPVPANQPVQQQAAKPTLSPTEALIGQSSPAFKLTTEGGKDLSGDAPGAPAVVLNFFSPRCGFCKKQMPAVEGLRSAYEQKGVRFIHVSQRMGPADPTREDCVKMMSEIGATGDLAMDPGSRIGQMFKVNSFPTMVILDKGGKIAAVNGGAMPNLPDRMKGQLDAVLAGKPVPAEFLPPKDAVLPEPPKPTLAPAETLIGKSAPAFKLTSERGKEVSSDNPGAPAVVLNFFAPKCGFCIKQMPIVDKTRVEYEEKGVRFVYVSQPMGGEPTKEDCTKMMAEIGVTGDLAMDPGRKAGSAFQIRGYPTMVILDKSGKVMAANVGALANLAERMKGQLDAILAGKPVPAEFLPPKPQTP